MRGVRGVDRMRPARFSRVRRGRVAIEMEDMVVEGCWVRIVTPLVGD